MAKQEEKKMEITTHEVQILKQQQNVLNLDTMVEEKIEVQTKKIVWKKTDGKEPSAEVKMKVLHDLVSPAEKRVEALEKYFASESYTASKDAALRSGNFLTQQIRSGITTWLATNPNFADDSAKQIFERWLAGFKAKNPHALKVLEQVKASLATANEDLGY